MKEKSKVHWFQKGNGSENVKSVIFVEATPEDRLIRMLRQTEAQHKISDTSRVKFVTKTVACFNHI